MKREEDGWYSRSSDPPFKRPGTSPVKVYPTGGSDIVIPAPKGSLLARRVRGSKSEIPGSQPRAAVLTSQPGEIVRQNDLPRFKLVTPINNPYSTVAAPYKGFQEGGRLRIIVVCDLPDSAPSELEVIPHLAFWNPGILRPMNAIHSGKTSFLSMRLHGLRKTGRHVRRV